MVGLCQVTKLRFCHVHKPLLQLKIEVELRGMLCYCLESAAIVGATLISRISFCLPISQSDYGHVHS